MMKNLWKMVIGFGVLVGIGTFGVSSASAAGIVTYKDGVYDHSGNEVRSDAEYYLEPVTNSNAGIIPENWSEGKWAKLGPKASSITVKFQERNVKYPGRFGIPSEHFFNLPREFALQTNVLKTITVYGDTPYPLFDGGSADPIDVDAHTYLTARSNGVEFVVDSAELGPDPGYKDATWILYDHTEGNEHFMAFKDVATGKILSHSTPGEWLYADKDSDSLNKNTLWKLIKK
ncbi:hypothetical protein FOA24_37080 [Bacillus thuringiensis]|uniref:hypothetical protein n=1 Tax=Bacillus thuringiensis TaxID=1428 RepID=UPI003338D7B6